MKTITRCIVVMALLLSGCSAVVLERPTEDAVVVIPDSPGPGLVWIPNSWEWDQRSHSYVQQKGYWVKPKRKSVWVDGYWKKTRTGWRYINGHWR